MTSARGVATGLAGALLCATLAGCGVSSENEPQPIDQPPPPRNTPSLDIEQPTTTAPPSTSTSTTTTTPRSAPTSS